MHGTGAFREQRAGGMLQLEVLGNRGDVGENYWSAGDPGVVNDWQSVDGLAVMSDRAGRSPYISHSRFNVWEINPDSPVVQALVV